MKNMKLLSHVCPIALATMKKDTPLTRAKVTMRYTTCSISTERVVSKELEMVGWWVRRRWRCKWRWGWRRRWRCKWRWGGGEGGGVSGGGMEEKVKV